MQAHNKVIWYEGMFLQPQHFQQHDRYFEHLIDYKHRVLSGHSWGFSELTLDSDLLEMGKIGIASAKGIFPDGTVFYMPEGDELPKPFDVPEGLNDTLLYLAIPLRQRDTKEAANKESLRLYRYNVLDTQVRDMVSDESAETECQLGSLNIRIVTEQEDLTQYTYLPLTKIKESRYHQQVSLDKTFITPWLNIQQSPSLKKFVEEVHTLLNHRAEMLAGRLTDTAQAGTAEIVDFMLLQLVNRYEPLFHYLIHKTPLHPEQLFSCLVQLMGEMATYTTNKRRPITPPRYQHEDLFNTFKPIIHEVRHQLSMVLEQNATSIALEDRGHGLFVGQIHDKSILEHSQFVLAVYADLPTETVRTAFPNQVKVSPIEVIKNLVSKALPGIPLQSIAVAPRQIPYHANFSYFSFDTSHPYWAHMKNSAGLALHVSSAVPGLKLECWAIKG